MDRLLDTALGGTARGVAATTMTGLPVNALVTALGQISPERRLLLTAGAHALYTRAGQRPGPISAQRETAPPDLLPACSPAAARTLSSLFADDSAPILTEGLERLRRAGLRLPHDLLVPALTAGRLSAYLRAPLLPTLDERGRWLARKNPDWFWAAGACHESDDTVPANAERIWQEGLPAERLAVLRRQRHADPATGRDWLVAVWKSEKAEFRTAALAALEVGLAPDDEPFLEAALDDRSNVVRDGAIALLLRLPNSALTARIRERADRFVDYRLHQRTLLRSLSRAISGDASRGTFMIDPPTEFERPWQRDGLPAKPPTGIGERAWWLLQIVSGVRLGHWTRRFAATPTELIAAARANEWGGQLFAGWTAAAALDPDPEWLRALWDYWSTRQDDARAQRDMRATLLGLMPPDLVFAVVEPLLNQARRQAETPWHDFAAAIPKPWSDQLARRFIEVARERLRRFGEQQYDPLLGTLPIAAIALPPSSFDAALEEWRVPSGNEWWMARRQRSIDEFTANIRLRRRLIEEIPL